MHEEKKNNYADEYKRDFENFLRNTDEKKVLCTEIEQYISQYDIDSVLDIGAGNGELSAPLAQKVSKYVAIEKNPEFVSQLRDLGIETIEAEFPMRVADTFDMVLASHAFSYRTEDFSAFITEFVHTAWELVHDRGIFLMIGAGGEKNDWYQLMKQIGEEDELQPNIVGYQETLRQLQALGEVEIRSILTFVRTGTMEDMISALTFVAGKGDPARKERFLRHRAFLEDVLKKHNTVENGFAFPFHHYFHSIQKG